MSAWVAAKIAPAQEGLKELHRSLSLSLSLSLSCGLFVATLHFCPIRAKHGRGAIMAKGCMGDLHSEDSKR